MSSQCRAKRGHHMWARGGCLPLDLALLRPFLDPLPGFDITRSERKLEDCSQQHYKDDPGLEDLLYHDLSGQFI